MTAKRSISRKILKIAAYTLGVLLVLLLSFHFWFINHAESLVEDMVRTQSNGKLHLKVKRFKFNWFSHKMEMDQAIFTTTDTTSSASYRFAVKRLKMEVKAVWPIVFEKRFLIDSLQLYEPDITVTKLRKTLRDETDSTLSLPQEMGRVYHSIQDALKVLRVEQFKIHEGKFSLIDKTRPDDIPVRITHLDFHLDNLHVERDSTAADAGQKIFFSDNVALQTRHQDILFPDGRHRLTFSNFRINTRNRLAEFDSCTIRASKGDSTNSSFRIFFDKLRMTNIDFDTLYHAEVIKADSVYCINPQFRLDVDLKKPSGPVAPPKLNELIQQLTGDLEVAFVVVENGAFDINTVRDGRPSSFTSDHNNFSLQGLRIRKDAPRPLIVDRFAMAIRNYENFIRDSAFSIQFDSILINNNRISLSSFTYKDLRDNKPDNKVSMHQLELYGLSWDDLIFQQQLKAERVILYRPVIDYEPATGKDGDLFAALAGIGKVLQLDNLQIVDGQITIRFPNQGRLQLNDASLLIQAGQLVEAKQPAQVKATVDWLRFREGSLQLAGTKARFTGAAYQGDSGEILADGIELEQRNGTKIHAKGVKIASMLFDEQLKFLSIHDLQWQQASVKYRKGNESSPGGQPLLINGINGARTDLDIMLGNKQLNARLQQFTCTRLRLGDKPELKDVSLRATSLSLHDGNSILKADSIALTDGRASQITRLFYNQLTPTDSITVQLPVINFVTTVQQLIEGNIHMEYLKLQQPLLALHFNHTGKNNITALKMPAVQIGQLLLQDPSITYSRQTEQGLSKLQWASPTGNYIKLDSIVISNNGTQLAAAQLQFLVEQLVHNSQKGKKFDTGKGRVNGQLQQLHFARSEEGSWEWQGQVNDLSFYNFLIDSVGKHSGAWKISSARISDLNVQSAWLLNLRELVKQNRSFRLSEVNGSYEDSINRYSWHNAAYHKGTRLLTVDSFAYLPAVDLATFTARQRYQADYFTAHTGRVQIGPLDLEKFITDTILSAGTIEVKNGFLTDYRDKRIPREPGIVRPLLGSQLKQLPFKLEADSIRVINALVEYEEVNEKTNKGGRIRVEQLNGNITHVRNYNLQPGDSLYLTATALLAGTIPTALQVKEDYTDSLGGFHMHVDMGAGDLTILNPILSALASAELKSGILDTLVMEVVGREEMAYGQMKMLYRNLKVKLVQVDPGKRKAFKLAILNFFANTIIKNKNSRKSGTVYFRRLRDRSAINYLVKITLSGVLSNVGVRKAERISRREAKDLRAKELPPVLPGKK